MASDAPWLCLLTAVWTVQLPLCPWHPCGQCCPLYTGGLGNHTHLRSKLSPGSALRNHSWWGLGGAAYWPGQLRQGESPPLLAVCTPRCACLTPPYGGHNRSCDNRLCALAALSLGIRHLVGRLRSPRSGQCQPAPPTRRRSLIVGSLRCHVGFLDPGLVLSRPDTDRPATLLGHPVPPAHTYRPAGTERLPVPAPPAPCPASGLSSSLYSCSLPVVAAAAEVTALPPAPPPGEALPRPLQALVSPPGNAPQ